MGRIGVRVHPTAHPLVATLAAICGEQRVSIVKLARQTGLDDARIWRWYAGREDPRIDQLDCCFDQLGYRLSLRPLDPGGPHVDLVQPTLCGVRH